MHVVNLIASSLENNGTIKEDFQIKEGVCAVTGSFGPCVSRDKLLGKSFTNLDLLACPASSLVSVDSYLALKHKPERSSSWICDGSTFEKLNRIQVREKVFMDKMPDLWAGYVTTSYKKHGSLRAKINAGNSRVWLFEMLHVDCSDMGTVRSWYNTLDRFLRIGISRPILESGNCQPFMIKKIGLKNWLDFQKWSMDKIKSSLYSFMVYLLPSQAELKQEKECQC